MARAVAGSRLLLVTHDDAIEWLQAGLANNNPTSEERRLLIEAILLTEFTFEDNGTMAVKLALAGVLARQSELEGLTPDELRAECKEALRDFEERRAYWSHAKSHRARVVNEGRDNRHKAAILELARVYRSRGVYAEPAFYAVKDEPFVASNGDIVELHETRLVVLRDGQPIGRPVNLKWFRNRYWNEAGKSPAVAVHAR